MPKLTWEVFTILDWNSDWPRLVRMKQEQKLLYQNTSKPFHLPELELKSQKEKVEAGDNDNQPFIFAFESIPSTGCRILSDLRGAVAKNVLRLAGDVRGV